MRRITRTVGGSVATLLAATALALAVAVPASALGGTQNCTNNPLSPKMYVTASNGGNWYSHDRALNGSWTNLVFKNGGSRAWYGSADNVQWQYGSNLSATTFSQAYSTCA
jgi:hypothetical protein